MSKKIGESLLEKRLISPVQLDKALKNQLILGGHLGTCLIELGYIDEREFGQALAELHGLGYVEPEALANIQPEVARILTWKMAERYQMVPFDLRDKRLHVAVIDPSCLDRFSTLTRCEIVPFICPEFRIYEAMETYYDIERRPRFIRLSNRLESPNKTIDTATTQPLPRISEQPAGGDVEQLPDSTERLSDPSDLESPGENFEYVRPRRDVAEDLFEPPPDKPDADGDQPVKTEPPRKAETSEAFDSDIYDRLKRIENANELAQIVMDHFASRATNCIVFRVKADNASIWDWHGLELSEARAQSMVFPVTSGSIFSLMRGDGVYLGPVAGTADSGWFYTALKFEIPAEILLVPVYIEDRLASIIYADGGRTGSIQGSVSQYEGLARSLSLALQMLILKMKIGSAYA